MPLVPLHCLNKQFIHLSYNWFQRRKAKVFQDLCPGKEMDRIYRETEGNYVTTEPNFARQCGAAQCVSKDQIHKTTH